MTPAPGRIRRFRDHWRARRDGKRDGVIGIPTAHEPSPPPALVQIAQRAAEALAELCRGIATDEANRRDQLESAERDRRNAELDVDLAARTVAGGRGAARGADRLVRDGVGHGARASRSASASTRSRSSRS